MKKIIGILLAMTLLIATVGLAVTINRISLRAKGGIVNYIGSDDTFTFSKVRFSAYLREDYSDANRDQGQASIHIAATTESGERVVLNGKLKLKTVIQSDENRLYTDNTGYMTYWKKGMTPQRIYFDSIRYDLDKNTGLINIAGESDINFRVTGMQS